MEFRLFESHKIRKGGETNGPELLLNAGRSTEREKGLAYGCEKVGEEGNPAKKRPNSKNRNSRG